MESRTEEASQFAHELDELDDVDETVQAYEELPSCPICKSRRAAHKHCGAASSAWGHPWAPALWVLTVSCKMISSILYEEIVIA